MNIDVATTVKVLLILLGIGVIYSFIMALKSLTAANHLEFYRKRQELVERGWRLVFFAVLLVGLGFLLVRFGEPAVYRYFPPSPTITRTPTITTTPTITQTLQNTLTPTITPTLAQTYTPMLPTEVMATIQTPIGVETKAIFSPIQFSEETKDGWIINTTDTFTLPVSEIFAGYTYDGMTAGLRWTAVWLREGSIVCFETQVWGNLTGGSYYSDFCNQKITPEMWTPGDWEVQIFVGQTWKTSGRFTILGRDSSAQTSSPDAPLSSLTPSPSNTP